MSLTTEQQLAILAEKHKIEMEELQQKFKLQNEQLELQLKQQFKENYLEAEKESEESEEEDKREEIQVNKHMYFQGLSYGDLGIYCNPTIKINETLFKVKREEFQHPTSKSYYKIKQLELKEPQKYKLKFV